MSTVPVTMQDLELETAELLPSRETLCVWKSPQSGGNTTILSQSDGNVAQSAAASPNVNSASQRQFRQHRVRQLL